MSSPLCQARSDFRHIKSDDLDLGPSSTASKNASKRPIWIVYSRFFNFVRDTLNLVFENCGRSRIRTYETPRL